MVMKGSVQPGHIPVNNYELLVQGLPPILFTQIGGSEENTQETTLPDRTVASGGNVEPVELTASSFAHHRTEVAALEAWRQEGKDPVSPTYKKVATLIKRDIHGEVAETRTWTGVWVKGRNDADLDLSNEGEPAMIEWTFRIDKIENV